MAKRYSGDLTVQITYHDDGTYKGYVKGPGGTYPFKDLRAPRIPTAGHVGSHGVAYDSPKGYDDMARAAISFATYDKEDIGYPDYDADGTDYKVRRSSGRRRKRAYTGRRSRRYTSR